LGDEIMYNIAPQTLFFAQVKIHIGSPFVMSFLIKFR